MAQEDLDHVKAAWAAIGADDFDAFIEWIDPDVEFTSLVAEADAVTYQGHAGVRKWWDSIREAFSEFWAEAIDLREVGDEILAEIRLCGTTRGTRIEQTIWQVLSVRDGLVTAWSIHRTEEEALKSVRSAERSARQRL
jgi:ketosteroid isomerase-like protein